MQEATAQLNFLYVFLAILVIVGNIGFQIGLYWTFKRNVEIRLREHEEKLKQLDNAREAQGTTLAEINMSVKFISENIGVLFNKIDNLTKELQRD